MLAQFRFRNLAIPEHPNQEAAADCLSLMNWNDCASAVGMAEEMMAASGPDGFEPHPAKGTEKFTAADCTKVAHELIATRCTPTNSVLKGSSTSKQSSIASCTRFIRTS